MGARESQEQTAKTTKRRRNKSEAVTETAPSDDIDESLPAMDSALEFSSTLTHLPQQRHHTVLIPSSPSPGSFDPFTSTSLPITPRTQQLLHHYFSSRAPSSLLMLPMRFSLFSLALGDQALMQVFLAHYSASTPQGQPGEALVHTTAAAAFINSRLSSSKEALTDATIGAAANLAACESSNGRRSSMIVHMNGLERMVSHRGGLEKGGFGSTLKRMVRWTDYRVASALLLPPRFPQDEDHLGREGGIDALLKGVRAMASLLRTLRSSYVAREGDIR